MKLTIIVITHRADKIFFNCLKSTQFADEIIIVDNNSNNDWQKLSQKFHFKLLKWPDKITNFSKIKNWAGKQADNNWILSLDSDEIIDPNSAAKIKKIIKNSNYSLISVKREDYFLGKKIKFGEAGNYYMVRLGQKKIINWQRPVHEYLEKKTAIFKSKIIIKHLAHNSICEFFDAIKNYAWLEANYRLKKQKRVVLSTKKVYLELIFYPIGKFILNYFIKLGLLDGWRGLIYAAMMSLHSLFVRIFLYELQITH